MMEATDLSDGERLLLAREAAADSYRAGGYVYDQRQLRVAFSAGWDAAVEWMGQRVQNAYEDAAIIAENCTQDDAARDEPFRIAQTIREQAKTKTDDECCHFQD